MKKIIIPYPIPSDVKRGDKFEIIEGLYEHLEIGTEIIYLGQGKEPQPITQKQDAKGVWQYAQWQRKPRFRKLKVFGGHSFFIPFQYLRKIHKTYPIPDGMVPGDKFIVIDQK